MATVAGTASAPAKTAPPRVKGLTGRAKAERKLGLMLTLLLPLSACAEEHIYIADAAAKHVVKMKWDGTVLWQADNNNGQDVQVLKTLDDAL